MRRNRYRVYIINKILFKLTELALLLAKTKFSLSNFLFQEIQQSTKNEV